MRIAAHLFVMFMLIFAVGCSRYPSIPDVEKLAQETGDTKGDRAESGAKPLKIPEIQRPASIGEVFQKKVGEIIGEEKSRTDKDYIIGPEDVLKVQVWDNDDLNRTVHISRQGEFSYPLIGKVKAEGLTVSGLEKEITTRLAKGFIVDPQVTVSVEEYNSKRVYVMGEVGGPKGAGKGPGTYPLTGQTITLMEIISKAGGLTREAGDEVLIIRPASERKKLGPVSLHEAGEEEVIKVNLRLMLEGDTSQNIVLQHGDTILVPEAEYFYVFGEVKNPGRYIMEKGTTVLKAITIAGGVTKFAAGNRTVVVREKEGERVKIPARMGSLVQPEDIIIVPENPF
jgi:polysaccharide export outer membrane protein